MFIQLTGRNHVTSLLDAARRHDIQAIRDLLARGADPQAKSEGGNNALIYLVQAPPPAGEDEWEAEFESLAQSLEDPTYRSGAQELAAMRLLIERGIDIEATDAAGDTALGCAVVADNLPAVELLLEARADGLRFGRYPRGARAAYRVRSGAAIRSIINGFRLARTLP